MEYKGYQLHRSLQLPQLLPTSSPAHLVYPEAFHNPLSVLEKFRLRMTLEAETSHPNGITEIS